MNDDVDVFSGEFIESMKAELRERVSERRLAHIMGVAQTSEELARIYGVDLQKAYLAGLLHDWDKNYDDEGIRARARELGVDLPVEVIESMPQTLHGPTAAAYFAQRFPQMPRDVLDAIDRHTTGAIDMTPLDMVVFIADALEPGRHFDGLDDLRNLVGKVDLEDLFLDVQAYWISLIVARKKTLHPITLDVWNFYALRHKNRKGLKVTDPDKVR